MEGAVAHPCRASHPMNVKIISPPLDTTQPNQKML
jgi:hypothetical protein